MLPEILQLSDLLSKVLSTSLVSGFLIAFIPWLVGMVIVAFKKIILS